MSSYKTMLSYISQKQNLSYNSAKSLTNLLCKGMEARDRNVMMNILTLKTKTLPSFSFFYSLVEKNNGWVYVCDSGCYSKELEQLRDIILRLGTGLMKEKELLSFYRNRSYARKAPKLNFKKLNPSMDSDGEYGKEFDWSAHFGDEEK